MTDAEDRRADPGAAPSAERTPGEGLPEAVLLEPPVPGGDRTVPPWLSRAIALAAGWVVLLFVSYWVLGRLPALLLMVLVAFFLSLAMEPAVDRLARRGWRRGSATALVLGGVLAFTVGFLAAAGALGVGQAGGLLQS